jgi:protein SCO1
MKHSSFSRVLCVAASAFVLAGCGPRREPLPVYGQVPDFKLTAQNGRIFDAASLRGKPWVANFIFTRCTGPCPRNSYMMSKLQAALGKNRDVQLVSFSVDAEYDTPAVLAEYATRYHAEPDRWYFLTGNQDLIDSLNRDAFHLSGGGTDHSTRWVLVDAEGRIRAYYRTGDELPVPQVLEDLKRLGGERS